MSLYFTNGESGKVRVQVITDEGLKFATLPIDFLEKLILLIQKDGEAAMLFNDNSYILAKGFIFGNEDFFKQDRIILIGANK